MGFIVGDENARDRFIEMADDEIDLKVFPSQNAQFGDYEIGLPTRELLQSCLM